MIYKSSEKIKSIMSIQEKENIIGFFRKIESMDPKPTVEETQKILRSYGKDLSLTAVRGLLLQAGFPVNSIKEKVEMPSLNKTIKKVKKISKKNTSINEEMMMYIPKKEFFKGYIERSVDKRLAIHYDSSRINNWKYPITQGKQGTGKTFSHMYYAFKKQIPFFLFSCYEDFKLQKLFGDKSIKEGNIIFIESIFVKAIQGPSCILFDEINAISNENSFDFHALLQNRELFIKDANNGYGKIYKLHPECRIGFAQNPKSAKYMGGNIKPSNFLGRCTYITYPEFKKTEIKKSIKTMFPALESSDIDKFTQFYFACIDTISSSQIPVDISIRQLKNVIDLYSHGMPLKHAIEDGLTSIMEAISQPKNKEAFLNLAKAVWKEMMEENKNEQVGELSCFLMKLGRVSNAKKNI